MKRWRIGRDGELEWRTWSGGRGEEDGGEDGEECGEGEIRDGGDAEDDEVIGVNDKSHEGDVGGVDGIGYTGVDGLGGYGCRG